MNDEMKPIPSGGAPDTGSDTGPETRPIERMLEGAGEAARREVPDGLADRVFAATRADLAALGEQADQEEGGGLWFGGRRWSGFAVGAVGLATAACLAVGGVVLYGGMVADGNVDAGRAIAAELPDEVRAEAFAVVYDLFDEPFDEGGDGLGSVLGELEDESWTFEDDEWGDLL